jgi:putative transposase
MASKGTRYTEEQIIRMLRELESGTSIAEVCRRYGVSEQTVYRWRSKYGGLGTAEIQRLRELEAENSRLKRIVAQQALDIDGLKELLGKKWKALGPGGKRWNGWWHEGFPRDAPVS